MIFYFRFSLGAVSLRVDTVEVHSSAERSTVSLQSISLSAIKALTDNMESCCPASQTPNPVLKLAKIAFSYFITTHTLQVYRSPYNVISLHGLNLCVNIHIVCLTQVQCEEELTVEWTPPGHIVLYQHTTEALACWRMLCGETAEDGPVEPTESEILSGPSRGLCVRVELGCTRLTAHVSEHNYILLKNESLTVSRQAGSMHIRSPCLILNLDGNDIVTFKSLDVETHAELTEMRAHRDAFPFLTTPHNCVWVLTCPSLAVEFPYQYNFSNTFDMAINVQKWLKTLHRSPNQAATVQRLPPDLVFKVSQFSFVFLDDTFEIKLRDNYELMKDESKESAKRLQLLDKKVADLRKQHGELLPARKIEELYSSLEKKHIEIYIQRSRRLYANTPMRKSLITWTVSDLELVVLADQCLHGPEMVREQLRDIDRVSPFPRDGLHLVVQWCRAVKFKLAAFLGKLTQIYSINLQI